MGTPMGGEPTTERPEIKLTNKITADAKKLPQSLRNRKLMNFPAFLPYFPLATAAEMVYNTEVYAKIDYLKH